MLDDFVTEVSATLGRNPDYWGYDGRFPENKLPYADEIKMIVIQDISTTLAALRTGKIDWVSDINLQQSTSLKQTSPEIIQTTKPTAGWTIDFRNDVVPFNDIRVRKAMQLAIDRDTLAATFYGGAVDGTPPGMISKAYKGWYDFSNARAIRVCQKVRSVSVQVHKQPYSYGILRKTVRGIDFS